MFWAFHLEFHRSDFIKKKKIIAQLTYTLKNQTLKITQLEKAHFIKVNEPKLSQIELF